MVSLRFFMGLCVVGFVFFVGIFLRVLRDPERLILISHSVVEQAGEYDL